MNRKYIFIGVMSASMAFAIGCNNGADKNTESTTSASTTESAGSSSESSDPKGIGPHKNIQLTHPLDETMVAQGKSIAEVKCTSCHKVTEEKLVGPGWKGVTDRRTPEWVMNFITNTDEMIAKDTAAINMLEVCLVKMPNQGLSETDARSVLEYMRKNDGKN